MESLVADRVRTLDHAERWFRDGLKAVDPPGGLVTVEVDMSNAGASREAMKLAGTPVTYTHLLIHAAAAALTLHPELHRLLAGNKCLQPGSVDICLSVAGDGAVTPVMILKNAGNKSISELADEVRSRAVEVRIEDQKLLEVLRRWGWIVPLAFLRTRLIRFLLGQLWYRRAASGTFQISVVPTVDGFVPFLFNTAAALGAGRVQDRVVAVNGRAEVRPVMTLACCFDHKVWNGMESAKFLNAVKDQLEQGIGQTESEEPESIRLNYSLAR